MSYRTTPSTIELLLIDYISTIRVQNNHQSHIIERYLDNINRQSSHIRNLITRWLELVDTFEGRNSTRNQNNNTFSFTTPSTRGPAIYSHPRDNFNRAFAQSPISSSNSVFLGSNARRRRGRNIRQPRRRNILNQILETTLYTPTNRRPASNADISRNVTTLIWRDISNSTDQTLDPITQEHFQPDDRVSRIDYCGHLFMEDALNTYLTEFDHRCPICRYNISSNIFPPTSYSDAASRPPPLIRQNAFETSANFDMSYNFQNFPPLDISSNLTTTTNLTTAPTFQLDFTSGNFDNAINQLSNAMISSLSSALSNPDNSGNTISAEYSLFVPNTTQFTDNSTNTEDSDEETY